MPKRTHSRAQQGFSLLETLVAFSILAIALGVILRIFGGGAYMTGKAAEHAKAVSLVESLLAKFACESCPVTLGTTNGEFDDDFRWTMAVQPFPMDLGNSPNSPQTVEPVWVDITVDWGDADEPKSYSVGTLRLHNNQSGQPGLSH